MADYVLPAYVEKRVRYFDGQFLQDQDFIDEQDYQLDREHRINRLLHGPGVADGLAVTTAAANQVTVAPGTAIDDDGWQLLLAQATNINLPAADFNNKQDVRLYISYRVSAEDQQTAGGSADFTRWLERPQLTALGPGSHWTSTSSPVLLATLALDDSGRVTIDSSTRTYSGVLLPGPGTDPASMRATSAGTVSIGGPLTVTVPKSGSPFTGLEVDVQSFEGSSSYFLNVRDLGAGASGDHRFCVRGDGNVGIGTGAPGARLEVAGDGGTNVDLLVNGRLRSNSNDGGLWVSTDRFIGGFGNTVGLWNGNAWQLTVASNGCVGVGTGTRQPVCKLEVAGAGGTGIDLVVNGRMRSDSNDGGLWVASDRFVGGLEGNKIGFWNGGAWRLAVLPDGTVGIGTTNTGGQTLCVNGSAYFRGLAYVTHLVAQIDGEGVWWDFSTAGSGLDPRQWVYGKRVEGPSDLRLKTDLRPLSNALDLIKQLQAVRYRWGEDGFRFLTRDIEESMCAGPGASAAEHEAAKRDGLDKARTVLGGEHMGLVAQDVEAVLPELVHEVNGYKHIRYQNLTALVVQALKELSADVAELRAAAGMPS